MNTANAHHPDSRNAPIWILDPDHLPEISECDECGAEQAWVWWAPRRRYNLPQQPQSRWTLEPCLQCERAAATGADLVNELTRRLNAAAVPDGLRGRSLHRTEQWKPGELPIEEWASWVAHVSPRIIGIASNTAEEAARRLRDWLPIRGGGWLYLHGDVGTGKSQLIAAMIEDHMKPRRATWAVVDEAFPSRPGGRSLSGQAAPPWRWKHESDLMEAEELRWKGNPQPLYDAVQAPVLVVDDFGAERMAEPVRKMRARLVRYRIDGQPDKNIPGERPTIFISNVPWSRVVEEAAGKRRENCFFGPRTASRLKEWCEPIEVAGFDWRNHATRW